METLPQLTKVREDLACTLQESTLIVSGGYSNGYLPLVEKLDLGYIVKKKILYTHCN